MCPAEPARTGATTRGDNVVSSSVKGGLVAPTADVQTSRKSVAELIGTSPTRDEVARTLLQLREEQQYVVQQMDRTRQELQQLISGSDASNSDDATNRGSVRHLVVSAGPHLITTAGRHSFMTQSRDQAEEAAYRQQLLHAPRGSRDLTCITPAHDARKGELGEQSQHYFSHSLSHTSLQEPIIDQVYDRVDNIHDRSECLASDINGRLQQLADRQARRLNRSQVSMAAQAAREVQDAHHIVASGSESHHSQQQYVASGRHMADLMNAASTVNNGYRLHSELRHNHQPDVTSGQHTADVVHAVLNVNDDYRLQPSSAASKHYSSYSAASRNAETEQHSAATRRKRQLPSAPVDSGFTGYQDTNLQLAQKPHNIFPHTLLPLQSQPEFNEQYVMQASTTSRVPVCRKDGGSNVEQHVGQPSKSTRRSAQSHHESRPERVSQPEVTSLNATVVKQRHDPPVLINASVSDKGIVATRNQEHRTRQSRRRSKDKMFTSTPVCKPCSTKPVKTVKAAKGCCDRSPSSPGSSDSDSDKRNSKKDSKHQTDRDKKHRIKKEPDRPDNQDSSDLDRSGTDDDNAGSDQPSDDDARRKATKPHRKKSKVKRKVSDRAKKPEHIGQRIKPNKFNGKGSVETFLAQFEVCADVNKWTELEKAAQLKCCLVDEAGTLIWDSGDSATVTYKGLIEKLQRRYGFSEQQEKFEVELRARRQKDGESIAELYQDVKCMMIKAYPGESSSALYERSAKEYFLTAMRDRRMAAKIREREPTNLEAAFKHALRLEAIKQSEQGQDVKQAQPANLQASEHHNVRQSKGRVDGGLARRVAQLEQVTSAAAAPTKLQPAPLQSSTEVEELGKQLAEVSKEVGRLQALQLAKQQHPPQPAQPTNWVPQSSITAPVMHDVRPNQDGPIRSRDWSRVTCFNCGVMGHGIKSCKLPRQHGNKPTQPIGNVPAVATPNTRVDGQARGTSATTGSQSDRRVYLQMNVNGINMKVLLDTGSDVTLLPAFAVKGAHIEQCSSKILAANCTSIKINGRATIDVKAGQHAFKLTGLVTDHVMEVMIGIDFLQEREAIWNFKEGKIQFDGYEHRLGSKDQQTWCRRVVLQDDCIVPPRAEANVPTRIVYNDLSQIYPKEHTQWSTEPHVLKCGLQVSRVILPEDDDVNIPVRVLNVKEHPVAIAAGTVVSPLEMVEVCADEQKSSETDTSRLDQLLAEMVDRVDASVTESEKQQLLAILEEFRSAFSEGENDLGRTDVIQHTIDTGDSRPVRQALRRQPPAYQKLIREHVNSMLQQGIIEPAKSPWASNIVLVRKKDGSTRCCIDYRQVNALTRKDAYPLPRTDACLDAMAGAVWFSVFDLRSSYHQVPLDPKSADATAFICSEGLFRYRTMPFGLCNAGATFQRLMDIVMSGLTYDICLTYLDDVIVFGSTIQEQFSRLRQVLERLQKAGLKLKPSKCSLLVKSVSFLGHTVSEGAIGVDYEKIRHVVEWPVPRTLRETRGFLGLCGYYRRFVKDFGRIAAPLHALSEKNRRFSWTEECQTAFETLKQALTSPPVLSMPNQDDKFVLDCDASQCAIGAVLSQIQDGVEKPVAYASKKLSKSERNYCVTKKELLAVVFFVKYFRHYLLGPRFLIRTDHAALQWLHRMPDPVGQFARWIGFLEEFDFEILHRSGSRHSNADQMSRIPCRVESCPCSTRTARVIDSGDRMSETQIESSFESGGPGTQRQQSESGTDVDTTAAGSRLKQQSGERATQRRQDTDVVDAMAGRDNRTMQKTTQESNFDIGGEAPGADEPTAESTQTLVEFIDQNQCCATVECSKDEMASVQSRRWVAFSVDPSAGCKQQLMPEMTAVSGDVANSVERELNLDAEESCGITMVSPASGVHAATCSEAASEESVLAARSCSVDATGGITTVLHSVRAATSLKATLHSATGVGGCVPVRVARSASLDLNGDAHSHEPTTAESFEVSGERCDVEASSCSISRSTKFNSGSSLSRASQLGILTWTLNPRADDVVIERMREQSDQEILLVKRNSAAEITSELSEPKLLWTLVEVSQTDKSCNGNPVYSWRFAESDCQVKAIQPPRPAEPVCLDRRSTASIVPADDQNIATECVPVETTRIIATVEGFTASTECDRGLGSSPVLPLQVSATHERVDSNVNELGDFSHESIVEAQNADRDISIILRFRERTDSQPKWDDIASESVVTKALWQQWQRLEIHNGVLYRRFERLDERPPVLQLVVPYEMRFAVFKLVHGGINGGHMGRRRTELQLQGRAYWPGWTLDIRRYIRMCDVCAQYHRGSAPKLAALKPFLAGDVWETVSIDITGPHPRSRQGHIYLLTVMDHFSKWADAIPIRNHTAVTVAHVLFDRVFVYMGMPKFLLSDCGAEFESSLFQELCKRMDIHKIRTTPYRPSTNGIVERYHRSLNSMLAKLICNNQRDWCEQAPIAAAAYRASVHESTGFSPNYLVFGRESRMPVDIVLECPPSDESCCTSYDEYVEAYQLRMRRGYEAVREHLGQAAGRRKDYYDRKVKPAAVNVGDWVWYLYPRRRVGLSPKWQRYYTGPYLVVRLLLPNDVVLQKSKRAKSFVVHRDKVKLCYGVTPESWLKPEVVTYSDKPLLIGVAGQTSSGIVHPQDDATVQLGTASAGSNETCVTAPHQQPTASDSIIATPADGVELEQHLALQLHDETVDLDSDDCSVNVGNVVNASDGVSSDDVNAHCDVGVNIDHAVNVVDTAANDDSSASVDDAADVVDVVHNENVSCRPSRQRRAPNYLADYVCAGGNGRKRQSVRVSSGGLRRNLH